jgi:ATP-dependent DNA helicase RecG
METSKLKQLIAQGETLQVEFKGEEKASLNDTDLVDAVVCLANGEGGCLLVGVEDDGRVTGAKNRHGAGIDCGRVTALIRSRTTPAIEASVSTIPTDDGQILVIEVPHASVVVSSNRGLCVRRVMGTNGPECVPFLPHEHSHRSLAVGAEDFTAHPCTGMDLSESLDPLQFDRARKLISALRGDASLLSLDNAEMAKAMRLAVTVEGKLVPTIAGLLLFGREEALQEHLSTHQVAFQVLTADADVRVNEFFRKPLLEVAELFEARFDSRVEEKEVQVGLIRLPIPDYSKTAFREAFLNALFHRDYRRMGTVYVQWFPNRIEFSSPGSFPEGVTTQNILVHEPMPRNQRLYDAAKRIGLVEQTGRGVDKVFQGQLRYGRPAPDYSRTDSTGVRLTLRGGSESLEFAAFVFERERSSGKLPVEELIILNHLFHHRRVTSEECSAVIQRPTSDARAVLERLIEEGVIEAQGERRGRIYHFSAKVYRHLGQPENHTRIHGLDPIRQEATLLQFVGSHGHIRRENVMELCGLNKGAAYRLLKRLADEERLIPQGEKRGRSYIPGPHFSQPVKPIKRQRKPRITPIKDESSN